MKFIALVLTFLSTVSLANTHTFSINVNVGKKDSCLGISKQTFSDKVSIEMKKHIQEVLQKAVRTTEQALGVKYNDLSGLYSNINYGVRVWTTTDIDKFPVKDTVTGEVMLVPGSFVNDCERHSSTAVCLNVPVDAIIPNENQTLPLSIRIVFDKGGYGEWKLSSTKKYDKLGRLIQDDGNVCTLTYEHKNSPRFVGVDNPQTKQRILDLDL